MKFVADTHTHTIASGHAYSTVQEIAYSAAEKSLSIVAITDHGPKMKGASTSLHFWNLDILPREIYGVRIIKGAEANIINTEGELDLPEALLKRMEFVIASLHDLVIKPSSIEEHTNALVNVLKNPFVDAIGHPGNPAFPIDVEIVIETAKKYNKLIEINNSSFTMRKGSEDNCKHILLKCKEYGVRVICGSDAHFSYDVGRFDKVYKLMEETEMPEELVLNTCAQKIEVYLLERQERISNEIKKLSYC